eukprot:IDg9608t1
MRKRDTASLRSMIGGMCTSNTYSMFLSALWYKFRLCDRTLGRNAPFDADRGVVCLVKKRLRVRLQDATRRMLELFGSGCEPYRSERQSRSFDEPRPQETLLLHDGRAARRVYSLL